MDVYFYGSNTLGVSADDYQQPTGALGSGDNSNNWTGARVADNWITPSSTNDQTYSILDGLLLPEIQSLYTNQTPNIAYAVFRIQVDWDSDILPDGASASRFRLDSHRGDGAPPKLVLKTIPEIETYALQIGVSTLILVLLCSRTNNKKL